MFVYQNGDKCPCCGAVIDGHCNSWLLLFSRLMDVLGLERLPEIADEEEEEADLSGLEFTPIQPPPDAGIFPPVKPKI